MSRIEELIKEKCPNGVEYKSVKDICICNFWIMPSTPKYQTNGIPYITSKNIRNGKIHFGDNKYIAREDYDKILGNRPIMVNDFLISMIGTVGEVGIVKENDLPFYGQNMYLLRLNLELINLMFFYYYFTSNKVQNILNGGKNNSNQGYLKTKNIETLLVALPPLEIQEEIVRILDKFGELETELEAELEARKLQYEYIKTKLLNRKDNLKKLDTFCNLERGKTPIQNSTAGKYPLVVTTYKRKTSNTYQFDGPTVCIPTISSRGHGVASLNKLFYQEGKFALGTILCGITSLDNGILAKYIYYYLNHMKDVLIVPLMKGGANVSLTISSLKNIKIPIISLEEQRKIILILDKYNKYCNEILPESIELRRKQYEYYRNKLLSFKELKNE